MSSGVIIYPELISSENDSQNNSCLISLLLFKITHKSTKKSCSQINAEKTYKIMMVEKEKTKLGKNVTRQSKLEVKLDENYFFRRPWH